MLLFVSFTSLFLLSSSLLIDKMISVDTQPSKSEMDYLHKYNYMPEVSNHVAANLNNDNNVTKISEAVSKFQKYFSLKVTGHMNKETSDLMKKPRCGVSDVKVTLNSEYNIGSEWHKKHLTWKVTKYTKQVTHAELLDVIKYSLNVWAEVCGLTFEYTPSSPVDIEIGFYKGVHLGEPNYGSFDGRNGVLAHAYFPMRGTTLAGDTHMDDDELWAIKRTSSVQGQISLAVVFVHEFGHALGLDHEPDVSDSIMRPIYSGWADKVILSTDDIVGIRRLYGDETTKGTTIKSSSPTSSSTSTTPSYSSTLPQTTTQVKVDYFCRTDGIDAAVEHNKKSYLLFKDNKIRRVYLNGIIRKFKITKLFIGSLKDIKIDAAIRTYVTYRKKVNGVWVPHTSGSNTVYIFQGSKVHSFIYSNKRYRETSVDLITNKFDGLPNNLDAAFTWSGNNRMFFTKGNTVYQVYKTSKGFAMHKNYPRNLSIFKGLPENIDAALNMRKYDTTIFFKGNDYYKFIDRSLKVDSGYPKNVKRDWFNCFTSDLTRSFKEYQLPISRITNNAKVVPDDITLQEYYNGTLQDIPEKKILNEAMGVNQYPKGSGAMKLTTTFVTFIFASFIMLF